MIEPLESRITPTSAPARILVVDDDTQLRTFLVLLLRRAGYDVSEAPTGRHALDLVDDHQFDVVITDIVMPNMEGLETIRLLRKRCSPGLKIIAMSGEGGDRTHYLRHAKLFGADETIGKPFQPPELVALVRHQLSASAPPAGSAG